ncbi:MAG: hypothetical protein HUU21_29680, partial [Polyangiaceae bacterium]|nr:hypothetical protein [Polyangiaceae bacterium]
MARGPFTFFLFAISMLAAGLGASAGCGDLVIDAIIPASDGDGGDGGGGGDDSGGG